MSSLSNFWFPFWFKFPFYGPTKLNFLILESFILENLVFKYINFLSVLSIVLTKFLHHLMLNKQRRQMNFSWINKGRIDNNFFTPRVRDNFDYLFFHDFFSKLAHSQKKKQNKTWCNSDEFQVKVSQLLSHHKYFICFSYLIFWQKLYTLSFMLALWVIEKSLFLLWSKREFYAHFW